MAPGARGARAGGAGAGRGNETGGGAALCWTRTAVLPSLSPAPSQPFPPFQPLSKPLPFSIVGVAKLLGVPGVPVSVGLLKCVQDVGFGLPESGPEANFWESLIGVRFSVGPNGPELGGTWNIYGISVVEQ